MDEFSSEKRQRETEAPSRPKRSRKPILKRAHSLHDLVPLIAASSSMPAVILENQALMIMSLHSHLCNDEIIGWMAGTITENCIHIKDAFPVRALTSINGRINVEMDVENALTVRTDIENQGMQILGWYHSHPTFEVLPSLMDIDNQLNYQGISAQYFLGGIISPYLSTLKLEGLFTIFHVKRNTEELDINGYHPAYCVKYNVKDGVLDNFDKALSLVSEYKGHERAVQPMKKWKKGLNVMQKIERAMESFGMTQEQIGKIREAMVSQG